MSTKSRKVNMSKTAVNKVFVFFNSPHDQKFRLSNNRHVVVKGCPLSEILTPSGTPAREGKHGITEMPNFDWQEIQALYGNMEIFKSERIFAETEEEYGRRKAEEMQNEANGFEQVDPEKANTDPDLEV